MMRPVVWVQKSCQMQMEVVLDIKSIQMKKMSGILRLESTATNSHYVVCMGREQLLVLYIEQFKQHLLGDMKFINILG